MWVLRAQGKGGGRIGARSLGLFEAENRVILDGVDARVAGYVEYPELRFRRRNTSADPPMLTNSVADGSGTAVTVRR